MYVQPGSEKPLIGGSCDCLEKKSMSWYPLVQFPIVTKSGGVPCLGQIIPNTTPRMNEPSSCTISVNTNMISETRLTSTVQRFVQSKLRLMFQAGESFRALFEPGDSSFTGRGSVVPSTTSRVRGKEFSRVRERSETADLRTFHPLLLRSPRVKRGAKSVYPACACV